MNLDLLAKELEAEEGRVKHVYDDHLGYATIGIGFLVDRRKGGGLYDEEIDWILRNRIRRLSAELDARLPWWRTLTEPRQRVIFQMAYQMGVGAEKPGSGLLSFRNTLRAIREGRYTDAARGMRNSLWARQTPKRANRLADIMEGK